jgi:predicted metal-dependent phosphotriesterase family hydrolase
MKLYKQFGGGTIVENSSHGLQRNITFLKEVSQKTGVHVIAGTGKNEAGCLLFVTQQNCKMIVLCVNTTNSLTNYSI